MIGVVLVGHGVLAEAALNSLESVLGHRVPGMVAVGAAADDTLTRLKERITEAVRSVEQGQGTIVLTDMFGDSATNVSVALAREVPVQVVTGVNLPMVLRLACQSVEDGSLSDVAHWLQAKAQRSLCLVSDMVQPPKCVEDKKGD